MGQTYSVASAPSVTGLTCMPSLRLLLGTVQVLTSPLSTVVSHMEISNVSCMSCLMSVSGRHISYLRLFSNVYLCELFAKSLDNIRTVNTILFWRKTTTFTNNCFAIYCTVYIELRTSPACDQKVLSFANLKVRIKCRSLWDNFFFFCFLWPECLET